jgi:hypothetical protein
LKHVKDVEGFAAKLIQCIDDHLHLLPVSEWNHCNMPLLCAPIIIEDSYCDEFLFSSLFLFCSVLC